MDPGLALHRAAEAALIAEAPVSALVLDLGCHDGTFAALALKHRAQLEAVFGCDRDASALARSRRTGCYAGVVAGDAKALPFAAGTFNTVICNSVLAHVSPVDAGLAEIARVLRPSGRLIATVPTPDFHALRAPSRLARGVGLRRISDRLARRYDRRWEQRNIFGRNEWEARLIASGLTLKQWTPYLGPRASLCWSALFTIAHLGAGRVTVAAVVRRLLPSGSRRRQAVEGALSRWLVSYLGPVDRGGSALLVAHAPKGGSREGYPVP